jgi:hypothetical protein
MPRKAPRKAAKNSASRSTASKRSSGSAKSTTKSAKRRTPTRTRSKVGGSAKAAKSFGGKADFGVGNSNRPAQRAASRTSRERSTQRRNPRDLPPRAGVESREAGVGGQESGPGSYSGGDVDPSVIGVGTGSGVAASGPDDESNIGAAETTGGSEEFASGPPAAGRNQGRGAEQRIQGSTVDRSGEGIRNDDPSAED